MMRGKSSSEVEEMFKISYSPPQSVSEPTANDNSSGLSEANVCNDTDITSEADSMNM